MHDEHLHDGHLQYIDVRNRTWMITSRSEHNYNAFTVRVSPAVGLQDVTLHGLLRQIDERSQVAQDSRREARNG